MRAYAIRVYAYTRYPYEVGEDKIGSP